MTNTLPGDWTLLVSRANSDDPAIEDRVRDFDKLDESDQRDVVRGLLLLVNGLIGHNPVRTNEVASAVVGGYLARSGAELREWMVAL